LGTEADITYRKLEDEVDMQLLKEAIKKLNDREKNIMEMRFGFISGKERTQKEVADELGISQSYIERSNSFPSLSLFSGSSIETSDLILLFLLKYIKISFSIHLR